MDSIITKDLLKEEFKKYKSLKEKDISWISIGLFALFVIFLVVGMVFYTRIFILSCVCLVLGSLTLSAFVFFFSKQRKDNNIKFFKNLEDKIKEEAKEKGLVPFSYIYPYFISVNDTSKELKVYFGDNELINTSFKAIKEYKVLSNDEYVKKNKLPKDPLPKVKKYSVEVVTNDNVCKIDFINDFALLSSLNGIEVIQDCNTDAVMRLCQAIDKIIADSKKKR